MTEKLIFGQSAAANIDREYSVDVSSNLNGERFSEILCLLGLGTKEYLLKRPLLDRKLLTYRNQIAHGNRLYILPDEYLVLHGEVIQLIDNFRNDVENAAIQEHYLR